MQADQPGTRLGTLITFHWCSWSEWSVYAFSRKLVLEAEHILQHLGAEIRVSNSFVGNVQLAGCLY